MRNISPRFRADLIRPKYVNIRINSANKEIVMKKYVLLLLCVFALAACSPATDKKTDKGAPVAKVAGQAITTADVERELGALPEFAREFFKGDEGLNRLVDELVKKELLYAEAKKKGLDKDPEFVKKFEEAKKNALISRLLEDEVQKKAPQVSEKEIRELYDSRKEEFIMPTSVRLSRIVVKNEADAKKVYERLQKGEPFNKVAAEMSIDTRTAKSGGDLGYMKKGEMNAELEKIVFRLRKNQISMPITLKDGIHILVPTDIKGSRIPYDKISSAIGQQLGMKKQQEALDKYIEELKKSHKTEIIKENIAKINQTPDKPAEADKAPAAEKKTEKAAEKK
jgi:EpsD family peptidyl-prolyl cis-trans isomerase